MIIRRESIDSETGNTIVGEKEKGDMRPAPSPTIAEAIDARRTASLTRIQEVIVAARTAKLPRERELFDWEPDKLSPVHINMVLDRASGLSNKEIAAKYDYVESRVSVILTHPDSQLLISTILAASSDRIVDVNERLKYLAPEAMNVKVDLMRNTKTSAAIRDRIATDILDRAGYAPKKQVMVEGSVQHNHTAKVASSTMARFTEALEESNRVGIVDYSQHLRRPQDDEVAQAADLQIGAGHTLPVVGPLHSESTARPAEERVA